MSRFSIALLIVLASCERAPTREAFLRNLVQRRLVADMHALTQASAELSRAVDTLGPHANLQAAREAWREALLAWERVYVLRMGPIVDNSGLLRARFWPVREKQLHARLIASPPLDSAQVEQLGVDLRGLYALEWALYADASTVVAADESGENARAAVRAFARNVQHYADDAATALGDGGALAESMAERAQEQVSALVNQLVTTIETLASNRVAPVLEMHAHRNLRASEVQGAPSGSSRELVLVQVRASERLYRGRDRDGLSELVRPVAPEIDERVRARFARALRAIEAVPGTLEAAVQRDREHVVEAFRALKELELALKVDLASALGVTLTFTAGDGD